MRADPEYHAGMVAWLANKGERDCPFVEEYEKGVDPRLTSAARRQGWLAGYRSMGNAATEGRWGRVRAVNAEAGIRTQADYSVERPD